MERMRFLVAFLTLTCALAGTTNAGTSPDAQGWNGPGWYVTGSPPPTPQPVAAPDYILFEGPHTLPTECLAIYDRFYSPIGICRFLNEPPPGSILRE